MGRSLGRRFAAIVVIAVAAASIPAGSAFAGSFNSINSVHSIFNSTSGGTCNAAAHPAGFQSNGQAIGWAGVFGCGESF